jgi:glycosyltransferase involved in cell wall biosynthesis
VKKRHLLLCMTPGVGLRTWEQLGSLSRELKPFEAYVAEGWNVTVAAYDAAGTAPQLPAGFDIVVIKAAWRAAWTLRRAIASADIVRTNQAGKAWWYVLAARIYRTPVLLRCGWVPGLYRAEMSGLTWRVRLIRLAEGWAFRNATACMVATPADKAWLCATYRVDPTRVHLRPNFVDCELFKPDPTPASPRSVVCVSRLSSVKRLDLLMRACKTAGAERVTLVGEGEDRARLQRLAAQLDLETEFRGSIPQSQLPRVLQESQVFALTSKVEGHPKALLEAMACGMPCIGTRVPGIQEAIEHEVDGLLAESDAAALADGITRLFVDPALRTSLGSAARRRVQSTLSFPSVMRRDLDVAEQLVSSRLSAAAEGSGQP